LRWCLRWQGALSELLSSGDFEAKQGSASRALRLGKAAGAAAGPRYVALLGLGAAEGLAKPAGERYGANPYQVCAHTHAGNCFVVHMSMVLMVAAYRTNYTVEG
jgi:hypothetical protein